MSFHHEERDTTSTPTKSAQLQNLEKAGGLAAKAGWRVADGWRAAKDDCLEAKDGCLAPKAGDSAKDE